MESHSNDDPSQPVDPVAALRVANDAQARMAARVRSPWWVHVLRGVRDVGVARANPERWRFLALGAPWSIVALAVTVAAMAFVVVAQDEPLWQVGIAAGTAGAVALALGPVADVAARGRMGGELSTADAR